MKIGPILGWTGKFFLGLVVIVLIPIWIPLVLLGLVVVSVAEIGEAVLGNTGTDYPPL